RLLGDFVSVRGARADLGEVLAAVGERGRWSGELCARAVEPPERVWDVTLTPIRWPEPAPGVVLGHARTAVGIFRDVSEKHALEQLRADFLSMITHDIKVPLTVILGYTEMLTDPEPPPDQIPPDILTRIPESGETIHALVADETWLKRVVTNLLGNAIKYTATGGRITVSTAREDGRVAVAFRDTGRGIPADEIPHLFEKYRRVRETKRTEGTGLGLFIAKTIVEAHGGDVRVESTPGAGSTFTVLLPTG